MHIEDLIESLNTTANIAPLAYVQEKITNLQGDHFVLVRSELKLADKEIKNIVNQRFK